MTRDSIVLVSSKAPTNQRFGTGFVIYSFQNSEIVVTCAHVVDDVGGASNIIVDNVPAHVIAISGEREADLAILQVKQKLNKAPLKMRGHIDATTQIVTTGFQLHGKRLITRELQGRLIAKVEVATKKNTETFDCWDIQINGKFSLQKGYSGSPVLEAESGVAIGVISERQGDGKRGLGVSLSALPKIWNEIPKALVHDLATPLSPLAISPSNVFALRSSASSVKQDKEENLTSEVTRIYKLLGGQVENKIVFGGVKLDIAATFKTGPMTFRIVARCKTSTRGDFISVADMHELIIGLTAAQREGSANQGVFITTSGFEPDALELALQNNIQCLLLEDLHNQLVDFSVYSSTAVEEFKLTELYRWYIPLTGSDIEDYDSFDNADQKPYLHSPLLDYVHDIFFVEHERRIALLGNFGTGKSSFCKKICDYLLHRYITDKSQRIPILINLRDYRSGIDIHQVITNHLQRLPGIQIDLDLCLELQRMGRFFFILDGLDEMATKVDRIVVNENLREIERLFAEPRNMYLLTCRTHFFQERISDEILEDYRVVYLTEWRTHELESYLKKRFPQKWKPLNKKILSIPSLAELSKTPLFVEMIVRSLATLVADGSDINIASLYAAYVQEWIVKQSNRRGAVMRASQRSKFVKLLALKLYREERTELHYSDLYEVAREFSGYGDATKLDYFDTDARTCTFMTKDSSGNYGFRHRSFMEYFVATTMVELIEEGEKLLLARRDLSKEVLEFIIDIKISSNGISNLHNWSRKQSEKTLSNNSVKVLLGKRIKLSPEVEKQQQISNSIWDLYRQAVEYRDDQLMDRFFRASQDEIKRIIIRSLYRYYSSDTLNEAVEDVMSDVYLLLWNKRDDTRFVTANELNVQKYIASIIHRLILDRARVNRTRMSRKTGNIDISELDGMLSLSTSEELIAQDERISNDEDVKLIFEIINSSILTVQARQIFLAVYIDGRPIKEVAAQLNLASSSVRAMLYRTRKKIRDEIERRKAIDASS